MFCFEDYYTYGYIPYKKYFLNRNIYICDILNIQNI